MTGSRRRAALLSEYVDARIRRAKPSATESPDGAPPAQTRAGTDGREFDRLLDLARVMDELDLRPDEDETRRVLRRIEAYAQQERRDAAAVAAATATATTTGATVAGWRAWWRARTATLHHLGTALRGAGGRRQRGAFGEGERSDAAGQHDDIGRSIAREGHETAGGAAARHARHTPRRPERRIAWPLAAAGATALLLLLVPFLRMEAPVTAAEIARRADAAVEGLATPGHVLHRRSLVRIYRNDGPTPVSEEIVDEWTDGSQPARLAARGRARDGRLLWAQVNAWEEGELRVRLYRTAASPFAPRDVVVIRPTLRELRESAAALPEAVRAPLLAYLESGRAMYAPIAGDRSMNRAWLDASTQGGSRDPLTVAPWRAADGADGYELRTTQTGQPWLDWSGDGIVGRTMTVETVRYLLASTYLTQRMESTMTLEDGSTWRTTREVWFGRQEPAAQADPEAFRLSAPPTTRILQVSANDEITALAAALTPSRPPTN